MENLKADVVVCGAGASGLPAAVTAARLGHKVILIEEDSTIGGAPVDYRVQSLGGAPIQGIQAELVAEIKRLEPNFGRFSGSPRTFRAANYVLAYQRMLAGLPIEVLTDNEIRRVKVDEEGSYSVSMAVWTRSKERLRRAICSRSVGFIGTDVHLNVRASENRSASGGKRTGSPELV